MANAPQAKPQLLSLTSMGKIRKDNPEIAKNLDAILDYINKNVTPIQGNKVAK